MSAIPMLWPVYTYRDYARETVAVFLEYDAAVDFVNRPAEQHFTHREFYIAEPRYDRRKSVWFIERGIDPETGRDRVAA